MVRYCCTTDEGVADVIARTAPPQGPVGDGLREAWKVAQAGDRTLFAEQVVNFCSPFQFLRLGDELRRGVLSYLVEVTKDAALRRLEEPRKCMYPGFDDVEHEPRGPPVTLMPGGEKVLRGPLTPSAAASFDVLSYHMTATRAVCTAVRGDIDAVVRRAGSTASGRAWLEHLYCRRDDALSATAVAADLRVRVKLGRQANTARQLFARARDFRLPWGIGNTMFQPPSVWDEERRLTGRHFLRETLTDLNHYPGDSYVQIPEAGPGLAYGRMLTVDEVRGRMPGDMELMNDMGRMVIRNLLRSLSGLRITLVVIDVSVIYRGLSGTTPPDDTFIALDSALAEFFGDDWNALGRAKARAENERERNQDFIRRLCGGEPSLERDEEKNSLRDFFAESLGQWIEFTEHSMGSSINKCDCLVDIDVAHSNDLEQTNFHLAGDIQRGYEFELRVAAKCPTGDRRYQDVTYKVDTSNIYDTYKFSKGTLLIPLVPDVFAAKLECLIPGMN